MIGLTIIKTPVFYLNDDVTMRSILSGAYTGTPDGHAIYMQYPLTGGLAFLYDIMPFIPWMDIFFAGCIWACMSLVAVSFKNKWVGILCASVLFLPFFWYMHYTIIAAATAATGMYLICKGEKCLCSLFFVWISYMIRAQVGLLSLPFVCAALCWQVLCVNAPWKQRFLHIFKYAGILLAGFVLIWGIHSVFYENEEWQEYQKFNEERTQLYDYTDFHSNGKYAQEYDEYGMTLEEYNLLYSYNLMLDEKITGQKLQEIGQKIDDSRGMGKDTLVAIKESVYKYYIQCRYHDFPYNYIWIVGICILCAGFLVQKRWSSLIYVFVLEAGRSAVWIYLILQGRFPERVSLSLYLMELLLLLGMGMSATVLPRKIKKIPVWEISITILLVLNAGFLIWTGMKVDVRNQIQKEWDCLKEYCAGKPENLYFLDVLSSVKYSDRLGEEDSSNLMLLGGWLTKSPLAKERMEKWGGRDAAEVLYNNERAYLVVAADKSTMVAEYFENRFTDKQLVLKDSCEWEEAAFQIYCLE